MSGVGHLEQAAHGSRRGPCPLLTMRAVGSQWRVLPAATPNGLILRSGASRVSKGRQLDGAARFLPGQRKPTFSHLTLVIPETAKRLSRIVEPGRLSVSSTSTGAPRSRLSGSASGRDDDGEVVDFRLPPSSSPDWFRGSMNNSLGSVFMDCRDKPGNDTMWGHLEPAKRPSLVITDGRRPSRDRGARTHRAGPRPCGQFPGARFPGARP